MASEFLTKAWTALGVTTGTIQNLSARYNVEVSEDNTDGTGQILYPHGAISFDGVQLYARAVVTNSETVQVRVSPFVDAAGGSSGGSGGGGSAAPYVLPTASATLKGGVKVGSTLTIDGNGVLDSAYVLPTATASTTGLPSKGQPTGRPARSTLRPAPQSPAREPRHRPSSTPFRRG